jgi:CBS domain-containing protein
MHDIVEFLSRHAPFDALPEDALEELARSVEVEFFPSGGTIFRQGEGPLKHVWVVRRGLVELVDRGRVLDVLGEGELFGHRWTLAGLPAGFEARASEDTLTYRLPFDVATAALSRPAGLRYVTQSLLDRALPDAASGAALDPGHRRVAELVNSRPIICDADWSVHEAARRMAEDGASAALVRLPDDGLGILTDSDLRNRVVAGDVQANAPVTEVMSAPAFTITPDRFGAEAMLEMFNRNIRHLPVVWPHGEVLGILSDRDLLAAETRTAFVLRRAIAGADRVEDLRRAASEIRPAIIGLHDARVAPAQIGSIIAVVVDALTRRLIELEATAIPKPPPPMRWLALGSFGRREVVLSSDIDSGLVWDGTGDEEGREGRDALAFGRRVVTGLAACGFAADTHGATAGDPLFNRSSDSWRGGIRDVVDEPDQEKALVFLSLLSDGRTVYGIGDVRDPLEELHQVWHHRAVLRLMLLLALSRQPPTGFRRFRDPPRDFVVEHSGEHRGRLNIKDAGLLPIVAVARYASLAAGVHTLATRARLDAAATAGVLDAKDAHNLNEAHDLFWQMRLEHQVDQLRRGDDPDDYIDVGALDSSTRRYAREAFRAVSAVQRSLKGELNLPP